jgi:hypothetical protein
MFDADSFPPSPVPSDRRLWPAELPFTAFGQFGLDSLDLRVFDQDIYWVDRFGAPHLLAEMSNEYVGNVIGFLGECCEAYFHSTVRRWFIQTAGDQLLFGNPGADVLAAAAGGPAWSDLSPEQWLESTPLMRALRRQLAARHRLEAD